MKKITATLLIIVLLPALGWALEPSNKELYEMILRLEQRIDATSADAERYKAEAEAARKEANEIRSELARIRQQKNTPVSTAAITPPQSKSGLTTSVEVINLRPTRTNLDFATYDPASSGSDQVTGTSVAIKPDHHAGIRFGLGYDNGQGSTLEANFTRLTTSDSRTAEDGDGNLWGNWLHANAIIDDDNVTWAKGSYGLDLNSFDLGLRQQLVEQESFAIDLLAALRYANLKQKTSIYYRQDVTATTYRSATIEDKNNFKGWGPRVGFDMNWKIGHGFSFFNETAGSLLLGNYSLSYSELDRAAGSTTDISRVDINESETRLIPVVEIKVGAGYSRELKNGWIIGANAGYEWQNWFNMVLAYRFNDDVDSQLKSTDTTDLSLDGFFLETYVKF